MCDEKGARRLNYYEHHIGDYDQATAHLTACEDGIYSRLIRRYMASEKPLPADVKTLQRLVRAHSREEKSAVETVLNEFFELRDDGWHQHRCDEEIDKYHAKQPKAEERKENDRERQRRARERRKHLFEQLRDLGVVASFDATTEQLQDALIRQLSQAQSPTDNANVTPPVTRDNTATQTPDTKHQTPVNPKTHTYPDQPPLRASSAERLPPEPPGQQPTRAGAVCVAMKAEGLADVNPGHPRLLMLIEAGASDEEFRHAARTARERGKGFTYALGMLEKQREEAAQARQRQPNGALPASGKAPLQWFDTPEGISRKARELGIQPEFDERPTALRKRCEAEIQRREGCEQ